MHAEDNDKLGQPSHKKPNEGESDSLFEQMATFEPAKDVELPEEGIGGENKPQKHLSLSEAMEEYEQHSNNLLIFGLRIKQIREPVRVGNLLVHPNFNLRDYLKGYTDDDIEFIVQSGAVFAIYQPVSQSRLHLFSPLAVDDGLAHFRLFKPGWLSALKVSPVSNTQDTEIRASLGPLKQIFGQIWSEPMSYELNKNNASRIQRIYDDLTLIPSGYLELALRRFSRSYEYYTHNEYAGISELDDCLVDLVIALESIASKGGDSIQQSMALRTALLIGKSFGERKRIEHLVKKFYGHRSQILHGTERDKISEKKQEERFLMLEDIRDLTRRVINATVVVLKYYAAQTSRMTPLPDTSAEIIDNYLFDNLIVKRKRTRANEA
ncbi:hypothetical protein ACFLV3_07020 [Chloroflexota bacterium]